MKIFFQIINFFQKNKKNIFYVFFFVWIFILLSDLTFAAEKTDKDIGIQILNTIFKWIAILLSILTSLIGLFLYPEWTSWSIIWLDKPLKVLWILVSNVVYFIFAWIFIWIAFMNIIWKEWETYQLKQAIPRFIIWVFIVPFSWFFVQFIISLSSILTVAILSLPVDTFKEYWSTKIKLCEIWPLINTTTTNGSDSENNFPVSCVWWDDKTEEKTIEEMLKWEWMYSILYIYTYWVMKLKENEKFFSWDMKDITQIMDLLFKSWFWLLFIFVYTLLVIALWFALVIRGFYLWIFSIFSPIFWIMYFFKKNWWWEDWFSKKFKVSEFIALAMVPVYVSAALVFGLLFIFVAWKSIWSWSKLNIEYEDGNSCFTIWIINQKVCWKWTYQDAKNPETSWFAWFKWPIWTLILQLFWLVILWMAVMAALKQSEITKEVTQPIADFWDSVWSLIAKAPTYAPIIPGIGSISELWAAWWSFKSSIESHYSSKWSQLWQKAAQSFGIWDEMLNKLDEIARRSYSTADDYKNWIKEALSTMDKDRYNSDSRARDKLFDTLWKLWASDKLLTELRTKGISSTQFWQVMQKNYTNSDMWGNDWAKQLFQWMKASQITEMLWTWKSGDKDESWKWWSPLTTIKLKDKDGDWNKKIRVDGDTIINVKATWTMEDHEVRDLVKHLVNQNTIWTMTSKELETWLEDTIWIANPDAIMTKIKTTIETLKDENWKKIKEEDFWRKKTA